MANKVLFKRADEIYALQHAMQSGVAMEHQIGSRDGEPKHLRVGVNNAMVETGTLAALLIEKGIFTMDEFEDKLITFLQAEVRGYESALSAKLNTKVTLG